MAVNQVSIVPSRLIRYTNFGLIAGDTENFVDFVERNLRLYQIRYVRLPRRTSLSILAQLTYDPPRFHRHNIELAPGPASAYIRKILAEAIRSRRPYAVNVLLGGFDKIQDESHL
jgi:20S proteasome subunit beta 4